MAPAISDLSSSLRAPGRLPLAFWALAAFGALGLTSALPGAGGAATAHAQEPGDPEPPCG